MRLRSVLVPLLALCALGAFAGDVAAARHRAHRTHHARRARKPRGPLPSELTPPEPAPPPAALPTIDVPIVFVSRKGVPGDPTAVPGLGPHHRAVVTGGRLMIRDPDGKVRELLPSGTFVDVAHPSVSFDGTRIAFASVRGPTEGHWRLWQVKLDGSGLAPITGISTERPVPYGWHDGDDIQPCWIGDHWLAYVSTSGSTMSEYGTVPTSNIWIVRDDGRSERRITAERNGAETPAFDPITGRLLYARWWTNRHRPSNVTASGLTMTASEALGDSINLWQVVSVTPDSGDVRLELGDPRSARGEAAYAPAVLASGAIAAVSGVNLALSPRPGGLQLVTFGLAREAGYGGLPRGIGPATRIAGAVAGDQPSDPYHEARGLAAPAACAPAALPGGGIVYAYDPGARGDFGLWIANDDGRATAPLFDLPGTLELDPAPVAARHPHVVMTDSMFAVGRIDPAPVPGNAAGLARAADPGFTFHCLNLFANGPLDTPLPPAPPAARALRMRFFAVLPDTTSPAGDRAVLLREAPILPSGEIIADHLPRGVPLFEQVVDSLGHLLMSAHGPAHVPGFNPGMGGERRCIGCHAGHSTIPIPVDTSEAAWFDAGPSAAITASGTAPGYSASALVDRHTRGMSTEVGWVADAPEASIILRFPTPIIAREVALFALAGAAPVRGEIVLSRGGTELARLPILTPADVDGTHFEGGGREIDQLEVRLTAVRGGDSRAAALAEVEVVARMPLPEPGGE